MLYLAHPIRSNKMHKPKEGAVVFFKSFNLLMMIKSGATYLICQVDMVPNWFFNISCTQTSSIYLLY